MKKIFAVVLLALLPMTAFCHPGKTDRYGGHQCLKDCEEWGLFYKEYHLHDKDWKPIHISRKQGKILSGFSSTVETQTTPTPEPIITRQTVTLYRYVADVHEYSAFSYDPLLLILLVLLLLLLILRLSRKNQPRQ